ncbi:MAG: AAA family ATPase [Bradymonadia bacterium]
MQFSVQLLVHEHPNGCFTLQVVGEPELCVYTPDIDAGREELALMLTDRLERTHPGRLWRYVTPTDLQLLPVELPEALPIHGADDLEHHTTRVSVLTSRDRRYLQLWAIRWGTRQWVPRAKIKEGEEVLQAAVEDMMKSTLSHATPSERLDLRWLGEERLELLELEVEVASPMAFTGKLCGAAMLPAPAPPDEDKDEEDEDKDPDAPKGKKKRPPTPTFKRIGVNLSRQAKDGHLEQAHGRTDEVEDLFRRLTAAGGTSVVVVGPSGVGKTAVLNALVQRIVRKKTPAKIRTRPVWFVDASRLIAGEGGFGGWQQQCLDILQECSDAEVIWYVGDPLALLDAGRSAHSDQNVALMLKPHLAGGRITLVGECTPQSWTKLELRDAGFARMFSPWQLEEPEPAAARRILEAVAAELARDYDITVSAPGLSAIEGLCARFRGDASALGTALHFLRRLVDEADGRRAAEVVPDAEGKIELPSVTLGRGEVVTRFCVETGMPEFLIRDDLPLDTEEILRLFRQRIIGQSGAVRRMADLVAVMKAGLSDLNKPLGSFLFVGPTGVGKTETAKALAECLFGSDDRMVRFDMSEFAAPSSVHRFIGAGDEEGRLISEIRQQPFCVLLLDEIEKAHPAVFDVLLQLLGEARLTDAAGRTASFCNAVVIMTSNLGVETFKGGLGFGGAEATRANFEAHFRSEAERFFRPELFNRIDHVVPFNPLEAPAIDRITERELVKLARREGLRQRGVVIDVPEAVKQWLAERGVEPRYGARPLKRLIEQRLTAPLARTLSEQGAVEHQLIQVQIDEEDSERLAFSRADSSKAASEAGVRKALLGLVGEIGIIRDQVLRWRKSPLAESRRRHLRLMDRLSQEKHFWTDTERANALTRGLEPDRVVLAGFDTLTGRIEALEELAYEQLYDRRADGVALLAPELRETIEQLDALELDLYDRRFDSPEAGVLYLKGAKGEWPLVAKLLGIYLRLAARFGWTLKGYVLDVDPHWTPPKEAPQLTRRQKAKAKKRAKAEEHAREEQGEEAETEAQIRAREEAEALEASKDKAPLIWTHPKSFEGPSIPVDDAELTRQQHRQMEQWVKHMIDGDGRRPIAIKITGPHVCLLSAETGAHDWIRDHGKPAGAQVLYTDQKGIIEHRRLDTLWPSARRRVINEARWIIDDVAIDLQQAYEPRLHRLWHRALQATVYEVVFGHGAHPLFKRQAPTIEYEEGQA